MTFSMVADLASNRLTMPTMSVYAKCNMADQKPEVEITFVPLYIVMWLQIVKQCYGVSLSQQNINQYRFHTASMRYSIQLTKTGSRNSFPDMVDRNTISTSKTMFVRVAYTMERRPTVKTNGVNAKCNTVQAMLLLLPVYNRSYCIFHKTSWLLMSV
jgi:hypothetical protein